ncbi:MAG TPA: hypothetical protein VGT98_05775 [Candidatus Elarobacter sp.]|nr:hypothetical protein [Candidatus Elarobacter sp.]
MDAERREGPPAPPELPRALRLTTLQRVGLPILFAIPVLALFGVFGEHFASVRAGGNGVALAMRYPDRAHYRQPVTLAISVRNTSTRTADSLVVSLDTAFLAAFTAGRFSPPVDATGSLALRNVAPGEARVITAEVSGDRYWRHSGTVRVHGAGGMLAVPVSTFVFP